MRLSYLGKLPLFFTLGIDMRQFLLGTVQRGSTMNATILKLRKVSIPLRYGTTRLVAILVSAMLLVLGVNSS